MEPPQIHFHIFLKPNIQNLFLKSRLLFHYVEESCLSFMFNGYVQL